MVGDGNSVILDSVEVWIRPILQFIFPAACIVANLRYFNCRNDRFVLSLEMVFVFMANTWEKGNMSQYEC